MARILHNGFYWIGIAAAIGILSLPLIFGGRSSGGNPWAGVGNALAPVVWMVLLAIIAIIASLVAALAAAFAREPMQSKRPSWLPVVLVPVTGTVNVLILIAMGTIG